MKIVFVTKGFHHAVGGAESAARDWYERISEIANTVLVTDETKRTKRVQKKGMHAALYGAHPLNFASFALHISRKLKAVCHQVKPDLVHIHSYSGYVAIPPVDIPTLVTFHDEPFVKLKDNITATPFRQFSGIIRSSEDFMRRLILSKNPYVHATGTTTSELINQYYPDIQTFFIPNPFFIEEVQKPTLTRMELLEIMGLPQHSRIILVLGNINFRKAIHKIIDSAKRLQKMNDIHFVVVGRATNPISKSYQRALEGRIASYKLSNFHFTGYLSNSLLHNLRCHSDIFLSASQSEACNLALIEAASYGIPIITTNVGASRDLFQDEAYILPRQCTSYEIARAIIDVIGSPHKIYHTIREMSWENALKRLMNFYEHIKENRNLHSLE